MEWCWARRACMSWPRASPPSMSMAALCSTPTTTPCMWEVRCFAHTLAIKLDDRPIHMHSSAVWPGGLLISKAQLHSWTLVHLYRCTAGEHGILEHLHVGLSNRSALVCAGSSGGTTAVVAMRMAAAGFCSDTGESCCCPDQTCISAMSTHDQYLLSTCYRSRETSP